MRTSLWLACAIALSVCLAGPVLAQGNGNGGGQGGGGGGGGGGGPPPDAGPPPPAPEPAPQPAPAPEPAPAPAPESGGSQANGNGGSSASAPGQDPNGPGNSENAPGHDPNGPGNSEVAHSAQPESDEPAAPVEDVAPENAGGNGQGSAKGGGNAAGNANASANDRRNASTSGGRPEDAGQSEERGRPRNETGRRASPPALDDNSTRGPSQRAIERRNERAGGAGEGGNAANGDAGSTHAGGNANGNGLGGGVGASQGEIPAAQLERSSVSEDAQDRVAAVHVRREQRNVEVARGDVVVEASGVDDPARAFLVIIHANGTEDVLADGSVEAPWNTTGYENGYYTVEVRERTSSGETATVASARVLVENPRSSAVAVVAAVATGTVVSAGAGVLAARGIDAAAILKSAAAEASGEAASRAAEERLRSRTAAVASVNWTRRSLLLLLLAGGILAFFKVFAEGDDLLLSLPIAFLAAFVYTVGDYGAEWMIARSSGAQTRFRIWAPGAISLAVSSLLFRAPFGYPGYVSETDVGHPAQREIMRQKAGLRALAFMGVGIALTLPFLIVGTMWRWELAEYGIGLALMMGAAGAMPFSPMPGKDVWVWSKLAWAGITGVLMALYLLWQLALLPIGLLVAAGIVGGTAFAMGLRMLRPAKAG